MNRYEMMMAAADAIERNPQNYDFGNTSNPRTAFDKACLLGEMWRQAGLNFEGNVQIPLMSIFRFGRESEFFHVLSRAAGFDVNMHMFMDVVPAVRALAQTYKGIPESVRDIFKPWPVGVPSSIQFAPLLNGFQKYNPATDTYEMAPAA